MTHVHISENDRSTPGQGQVDWEATFDGLKRIRYDGWLTIEAFGLALPSLAAATKIWRKMFVSEEQLASDGLRFMQARVGQAQRRQQGGGPERQGASRGEVPVRRREERQGGPRPSCRGEGEEEALTGDPPRCANAEPLADARGSALAACGCGFCLRRLLPPAASASGGLRAGVD